MYPTRGIHWEKPTTLLASTLIGTALAIGHHFFYNSLDRKPTPNGYLVEGFGYRLTHQQTNIAAGSAFAFLFKSALGVAVSAAYEQVVWAAVKNHATQFTVMDDVFSLLGNFFALFKIELWRKYPPLMLVIAIYWMLPIASIATPATLSVELAVAQTNSSIRVPRVDFTSMNFANLPGQQGTSPFYAYVGPQYSVERVVGTAVAQGEILPISAPYINSSWILDFHGPALQCDIVDRAAQDMITGNVADAMTASQFQSSYGYISWTPGTGINGSLPFHVDGNSNFSLRPSTVSKIEDGSALTIFVAAFPAMVSEMPMTGTSTSDPSSVLGNSTILKCHLYNSSYSTSFTYHDGEQNVGITLGENYGVVPFLKAAAGANPLLATYPNLTAMADPPVYNATMVENFAYQAVMDSFGRVLVGSIANMYVDDIAGLTTTNTSVMSTVLSQTNELDFLGNWSDTAEISLSNPIADQTWNGYSVLGATGATIPLAEALEQVFRNVTVSLMNSELLQPNYTSPYAPLNTTVIFTPYRNVYTYSCTILWTAYGLALFFSSICVSVGLFKIHENEASYSNKFSTIARVTRDAALSMPIQAADTAGEDPLPKRVGAITIRFSMNESEPGLAEEVELKNLTSSTNLVV